MKYVIPFSAVILPAILLCACGGDKKEKEEHTEKQTQSYKLMSLQASRLSSTIQLPGVLEPYQFVQIFPKISGFVKSVAVDRGSVVRNGQVLLQLEAPEVEEHMAAAKLKYTQAQAMYQTSKDRYQRLLETSKTPGTVAPYDLAAAQSKMEADVALAQGEQANYKAQQDMLHYLTITAPFDGVITERNVHPGAIAGPGTQGTKPMLVLQQQSRLRLVVNIPEQYSNQVNDKDEVHYRVNAMPGQDFTGKVARSSNSLSNSYRSETIEVDVENKGDKFKPGMYAEVVLPASGNANAFVVPKSSVVTTTERKYIITNDGGKAHLVDVSTGNQQGDSTEVFGNFHDGDQVITNASYQLKEGTSIAH